MDGVDDLASVSNADTLGKSIQYLSDTIAASTPSGVDQPDMSIVLLDLLSKQGGVDVGVEGQESLTEA